MKYINKLKAKAQKIKKNIRALYYVYKDPDVRILPKIIILITLGYALSPIDLIPDFIPIFGYLDDLIVVPALIALSIKLIPKEKMEQAKIKAENEPLKLKKNWFFATIFIVIWIILSAVVIRAIVNLFK